MARVVAICPLRRPIMLWSVWDTSRKPSSGATHGEQKFSTRLMKVRGKHVAKPPSSGIFSLSGRRVRSFLWLFGSIIRRSNLLESGSHRNLANKWHLRTLSRRDNLREKPSVQKPLRLIVNQTTRLQAAARKVSGVVIGPSFYTWIQLRSTIQNIDLRGETAFCCNFCPAAQLVKQMTGSPGSCVSLSSFQTGSRSAGGLSWTGRQTEFWISNASSLTHYWRPYRLLVIWSSWSA